MCREQRRPTRGSRVETDHGGSKQSAAASVVSYSESPEMSILFCEVKGVAVNWLTVKPNLHVGREGRESRYIHMC